MSFVQPVFAIPAWHAYEHYTRYPKEERMVLAKDQNNVQVELRIRETQPDYDLPKEKIVEQIVEIDSGWFAPITYTEEGVVNWASRPLRTGLVIHEVA